MDISERFLKLAANYASAQGIPSKGIRSSFEELPTKLGTSPMPRFVSLGLTYSNYPPHEIVSLLKSMVGTQGSAFINAQLRERTDINKLTAIYAQDGYNIAKSKLAFIGLDSEKDILETHTNDRIQIWSTVKNSTPVLEKMGIVPGTTLLIFQSLRPTLESLKKDVTAVFPNAHFFDTGETYVGTLLK